MSLLKTLIFICGLKMSNKLVEFMVIGMFVLIPVAAAAQPEAESQAEAPSLEMLEFLGFWETPGGELIDPLNLRRSETINEVEDEKTREQKEKVIVHD